MASNLEHVVEAGRRARSEGRSWAAWQSIEVRDAIVGARVGSAWTSAVFGAFRKGWDEHEATELAEAGVL